MADSTERRIEIPPFPPVTHPTITAGATLDRANVTALVTELDRALRGKPARVYVDLEAVESFDSAGLGGVVAGMRKAKTSGCEIKLRGVSQSMLDYFSLVSIERLVGDVEVEAKPDPVTRLGAMVEPMLDGAMAVCVTAVDAAREVFVGPFQRRFLRMDRLAIEVDHCAAGALPIITLIAFLLGLILAMQAYVQLRVWGAEIYIADMVGVSVLAEIGPLMTAIVLAARSGSRNAAQLGSMVVSEEVAAIEQMGIRTISFLVAPKVLACAFASVALSIVFDVVGMCGGALFAWSVAGIELDAFGQQLRNALHLSDFVVALCKAMTFGAAVGVVGCALGLRVKDGSEGVGRATTNAVVLGIFLVIVIDAVFVTAQRFLT